MALAYNATYVALFTVAQYLHSH